MLQITALLTHSQTLYEDSRNLTSFTGGQDNWEKSMSVEISCKITVTIIWQWLKKSGAEGKELRQGYIVQESREQGFSKYLVQRFFLGKN